MKLSDIMSAMNLAVFAEVGLVIFMAVFLVVALHVLRRGPTPEWEAARRLPLGDGERMRGERGGAER